MKIVMQKHPFYGVEVRKLDSLDEFRPQPGDPERIYQLDIGDGMEIGFLVNPAATKVLRVGFHAAKGASAPPSHMYAPVSISRESGTAFVLFSDPTLSLDYSNKLAWYLGTPDVDPDDWMEAIVRQLLAVTGAEHILAEGSSGGGFVSMRFASRFRQAVAVPKVPQTDLFRYRTGPLADTMRMAWKGYTYAQILEEHSRRFRLADIYATPEGHRGNLIHYVQNAGDTDHVADQLTPFLAELGSGPHVFSAGKGLISISRPFLGTGHKGIPSPYWTADAAFALERLRLLRPYEGIEGFFVKPVGESALSAVRKSNIAKHLTTGW